MLQETFNYQFNIGGELINYSMTITGGAYGNGSSQVTRGSQWAPRSALDVLKVDHKKRPSMVIKHGAQRALSADEMVRRDEKIMRAMIGRGGLTTIEAADIASEMMGRPMVSGRDLIKKLERRGFVEIIGFITNEQTRQPLTVFGPTAAGVEEWGEDLPEFKPRGDIRAERHEGLPPMMARREMIVDLLRDSGTLSLSAMVKHTGISSNGLQGVVLSLTKDGTIIDTGNREKTAGCASIVYALST